MADAPLHEARLTFGRTTELLLDPVEGRFEVAHLLEVHRRIFQDLPHHGPGEIRPPADFHVKARQLESTSTRYYVHYAPQAAIAPGLADVLSEVEEGRALQGLSPDEFSARLARLYADLDYLHPFREGNSRTLRVFTAQLAAATGHRLDWGTSTANAQSRDRLYVARDRAVLERAFPGLDEARAMATANPAEYEAFITLQGLRQAAPLEALIRGAMDRGPSLGATPLPPNRRAAAFVDLMPSLMQLAAANPDLAPHQLARKFVLDQGAALGGVEIVIVLDTNGTFLAAGTQGLPNAVDLPPGIEDLARTAGGQLVIHHNHPNGTPISATDLHSLGGQPGLGWIVAHTDHAYSAAQVAEVLTAQLPDPAGRAAALHSALTGAQEAAGFSLFAAGLGEHIDQAAPEIALRVLAEAGAIHHYSSFTIGIDHDIADRHAIEQRIISDTRAAAVGDTRRPASAVVWSLGTNDLGAPASGAGAGGPGRPSSLSDRSTQHLGFNQFVAVISGQHALADDRRQADRSESSELPEVRRGGPGVAIDDPGRKPVLESGLNTSINDIHPRVSAADVVLLGDLPMAAIPGSSEHPIATSPLPAVERDPRENQQFFVHLDDGTAYFVTWTPAGESGTMRFAAGDPDFDTWCNTPQDFTYKTMDLMAHGVEGWAEKQIGPRHAAHLIELLEKRCGGPVRGDDEITVLDVQVNTEITALVERLVRFSPVALMRDQAEMALLEPIRDHQHTNRPEVTAGIPSAVLTPSSPALDLDALAKAIDQAVAPADRLAALEAAVDRMDQLQTLALDGAQVTAEIQDLEEVQARRVSFAEQANRNVQDRLSQVFRNPSAAVNAWFEMVEQHGLERATDQVNRAPDSLGSLHGLTGASSARQAALAAAQRLGDLCATATTAALEAEEQGPLTEAQIADLRRSPAVAAGAAAAEELSRHEVGHIRAAHDSLAKELRAAELIEITRDATYIGQDPLFADRLTASWFGVDADEAARRDELLQTAEGQTALAEEWAQRHPQKAAEWAHENGADVGAEL